LSAVRGYVDNCYS